jgi:hypothetical protein
VEEGVKVDVVRLEEGGAFDEGTEEDEEDEDEEEALNVAG